MIGLAGLVVSAIGLLEAADVQPVRAWLANFRYGDTYFGDVYRVSSTLVHPNTAAMALELTLPIVLAWALTTRRRWLRAALVAGLFVELVTLALTLSRGGAIALLISLALTGALAVRFRVRPWVSSSLTAGGGAIFVVVLTLVLNPSLIVRLTSESGNAEWYRAEYQVPASLEARPGAALSVPVEVTNRGLAVWQTAGNRPFNLSYHLTNFSPTQTAQVGIVQASSDDAIMYSGVRTPLPTDVPPNSSVRLSAQVAAPPNPGDYVIEWDMIQEGVTWFSRKGQAPGLTRLKVQGEPVAVTPLPQNGPKEGTASADASRLTVWMTALQVAVRHTLLGVGPYNFRWYLQDNAVSETAYHANSAYFEMLADTGFLGFAAFVWLLWAFARAAWKAAKKLSPEDSTSHIWWLALATSVLAWLAHGTVDFFYANATFTGLALIAGLLLGLGNSPFDAPTS
jgi:hypothetical protein